MTASTEPLHEPLHIGLTIGQAASALRISPSTVRRWVRSGRLQAEQVVVGDGFEYRIHLEGVEASRQDSVNPSSASQVNPSTEAFVNPSTVKASRDISSTTSQADAMVSLIQTTIATVLGPLVTQIEAQRGTIERQSEQLVSQAEIIGQLRAENVAQARDLERLTALAPSYTPGAAEPEPEAVKQPPPPSSPFPAPIEPSKNAAPWWQRWLWMVGVAVVLVWLVLVQVWPR